MRYQATPGVVCRKIAGEVMLVPVEGELATQQRVFFLDTVGELVWEKLEDHDTSRLVDIITEQFDVDAETAQADLQVFLDQLCQAGLAQSNSQ